MQTIFKGRPNPMNHKAFYKQLNAANEIDVNGLSMQELILH